MEYVFFAVIIAAIFYVISLYNGLVGERNRTPSLLVSVRVTRQLRCPNGR